MPSPMGFARCGVARAGEREEEGGGGEEGAGGEETAGGGSQAARRAASARSTAWRSARRRRGSTGRRAARAPAARRAQGKEAQGESKDGSELEGGDGEGGGEEPGGSGQSRGGVGRAGPAWATVTRTLSGREEAREREGERSEGTTRRRRLPTLQKPAAPTSRARKTGWSGRPWAGRAPGRWSAHSARAAPAWRGCSTAPTRRVATSVPAGREPALARARSRR